MQRCKQKRKRKRGSSSGKIFIFALFILIFVIIPNLYSGLRQMEGYSGYSLENGKVSDLFIPEYEVSDNLSIKSSNAILKKIGDEGSIFEKNSGESIYPASMTKIMTAVVVLENINDLNERAVLNRELFKYIVEASIAGFSENEEVEIIDLLYGLLLPSGAECAVGLAEYVAGSESAFAVLMNDKARELGMSGTNFSNATGLHDKKHYSTVNDIAKLLEYALENETFYKIFTTSRHSSKPTNKHAGGITYYSTLFSNMENASFKGGRILGGKTGYTVEAGQCLASLAEKDGKRFILVTCGAPGNNRTEKLHIDDAFTIYASLR